MLLTFLCLAIVTQVSACLCVLFQLLKQWSKLASLGIALSVFSNVCLFFSLLTTTFASYKQTPDQDILWLIKSSLLINLGATALIVYYWTRSQAIGSAKFRSVSSIIGN